MSRSGDSRAASAYVTLRSVATPGWNAKGRISPLYARFGGREALAALVGISVTELSSLNSGKKNLGLSRATKIAEATGVTLEELGQPPEASVAGLAEFQEQLVALRRDLGARLSQIEERLAAVERRRGRG